MADTEPESHRGERSTFRFREGTTWVGGDAVGGSKIVVDYVLLYGLASAPGWAAIASVLKTYLTRNANSRVSLYGKDGQKIIDIEGDKLTRRQIEFLLRAHAESLLGPNASNDEERKWYWLFSRGRKRKKALDPVREDRAEG